MRLLSRTVALEIRGELQALWAMVEMQGLHITIQTFKMLRLRLQSSNAVTRALPSLRSTMLPSSLAILRLVRVEKRAEVRTALLGTLCRWLF